jgi:predicted Zn-dependent protease
MSDVEPSDEASIREPRPRPSRPFKWIAFLGVIAVGFAAFTVFWWRPWTSPSCIEDASHVIDSGSGVCYSIPEGWERDDSSDDEASTSSISLAGRAAVAVGPFLGSTESGIEHTAQRQVSALISTGTGERPVQVETDTVAGHDSATASGSNDDAWYMVTIIQVEDRAVMMFAVSTDPGPIAQIEEVNESLGVK